MARIVADRGIQHYQIPGGGTVRYHEFDLDCSCTLRVDESYLFRVGRMDFRSRIQQVADAHICEVEVFMVHTEAARQQRARQAVLAGRTVTEAVNPSSLRFLGADVSVQPDATGVTMWEREIIGSFRMDLPRRSPAEVGRAIRENPAPQQDPGAQVREAARRAEVSGVFVDEMIGFQAPKPKPLEKKSDPERPDRFQLIELD